MKHEDYIVTHTLSNGAKLSDKEMKGYKVQVTEETKAFYISLAMYARNKSDKTA